MYASPHTLSPTPHLDSDRYLDETFTEEAVFQEVPSESAPAIEKLLQENNSATFGTMLTTFNTSEPTFLLVDESSTQFKETSPSQAREDTFGSFSKVTTNSGTNDMPIYPTNITITAASSTSASPAVAASSGADSQSPRARVVEVSDTRNNAKFPIGGASSPKVGATANTTTTVAKLTNTGDRQYVATPLQAPLSGFPTQSRQTKATTAPETNPKIARAVTSSRLTASSTAKNPPQPAAAAVPTRRQSELHLPREPTSPRFSTRPAATARTTSAIQLSPVRAFEGEPKVAQSTNYSPMGPASLSNITTSSTALLALESKVASLEKRNEDLNKELQLRESIIRQRDAAIADESARAQDLMQKMRDLEVRERSSTRHLENQLNEKKAKIEEMTKLNQILDQDRVCLEMKVKSLQKQMREHHGSETASRTTSAERNVVSALPPSDAAIPSQESIRNLKDALAQQTHIVESLREQQRDLANEVSVLRQRLNDAQQRLSHMNGLEEENKTLRQSAESVQHLNVQLASKVEELKESLHSELVNKEAYLERTTRVHQELLHRATVLAMSHELPSNGVYDGTRVHFEPPSHQLTAKETAAVLKVLEDTLPQKDAPGTDDRRSIPVARTHTDSLVDPLPIPHASRESTGIAMPTSRYQLFCLVTHRVYNLPQNGVFLMGASETCDVVLTWPNAEPYHAIITCVSGQVPHVADLGSRKGIHVNGQRVGIPVALHHGARLVVGNAAQMFLVNLVMSAPGEGVRAFSTSSSVADVASAGRQGGPIQFRKPDPERLMLRLLPQAPAANATRDSTEPLQRSATRSVVSAPNSSRVNRRSCRSVPQSSRPSRTRHAEYPGGYMYVPFQHTPRHPIVRYASTARGSRSRN